MMCLPIESTAQFVSAPPRELLSVNHAIGVQLCANKDDEVVDYSLSRCLSPAMIAEYQTQLPDKKLLQAKLHEFYLLNIAQGEGL